MPGVLAGRCVAKEMSRILGGVSNKSRGCCDVDVIVERCTGIGDGEVVGSSSWSYEELSIVDGSRSSTWWL